MSKGISEYQPVAWRYIANMYLFSMRIIFAICHNTYFRKLCKSDVFLFYFTWCFILVVCVACNLHLITHTKRWTYPINHKCSPWRTNMAIGSIEWRLFQPKQCKQQTQQSRSREAIVVKVSVLFELVNLSLFFFIIYQNLIEILSGGR